jgi:hypothetical protein
MSQLLLGAELAVAYAVQPMWREALSHARALRASLTRSELVQSLLASVCASLAT